MQRKARICVKALLPAIVAAAAALLSALSVSAASTSAADFQMKGNTLVKYTGTAAAVSIPASVKHIGQEAFADHTEIKKVSIPAYVEDIAYHAFSGCTSLSEVILPDTVTELGTGAFSGCTDLKKVTLGKDFKKLGTGVFADCSFLSELTVHKKNESFVCEDGLLLSKDKTVVFFMLPGYGNGICKIPSSVKSIEDNAFWGCNRLTRVEIGSNVKEIPSYAFADCRSLEEVIFPYSVYRIGLKAFADCTGLQSVAIPSSVQEIHATAFDGCSQLTIVADPGSRAAEYEAQREKSNAAQTEYEDILEAIMSKSPPEEPETTQDSSGEDADGSSGSGSDGGELLGQTDVVNGSAMVFIDNSRSQVLSGNERPDTGDTGEAVIADTEKTGFPKFTVVNNEKIAGQAYYGREDLTELTLPASIKEIGDFAFARSGLTSIRIPEGVTKIGYGAFYHCDGLAEVTIPSTVTEIEPAAFDHTKWMEDQLEDRIHKFTVVGDGILLAYSGAGGDITIPEGVKQIGAEVFKDRSQITGVNLPDSLLSIGEDAFSGCSSLVSIGGGKNLEQIKDRAFAGCPVSTVKIPASVKEIGLRAFDFSGTGKGDGEKLAVFLGKELPAVSYEKTATRLANEAYRDAVLKDVRIAVVDPDIASLSDVKDTVLDYDRGGFRGFVCSVAQAADANTKGQLKIQFCVMHEEDVQNVTIPPTVIVYGREYEIINPEDAVVYASEPKDGQGAEGEGNEDEAKEGEGEPAGTVSVSLQSATLPATPAPKATLAGIKEDYTLSIRDSETAADIITAAFRKAAAGSRMNSLQAYELTLTEDLRGIPVTRTGKQELLITVPKPAGISLEGLHVVCTDEDGQLEKVEHSIVNEDGVSCIRFAAKHFSVYGFYN